MTVYFSTAALACSVKIVFIRLHSNLERLTLCSTQPELINNNNNDDDKTLRLVRVHTKYTDYNIKLELECLGFLSLFKLV